MLRIKFLLGFLIFSINCFGQNSYYDVGVIKENIVISKSISGKILLEPDKDNLVIFNSIFKNYLPDSIIIQNMPDSLLYKKIKASLETNPFIDIAGTALSSDLLQGLNTFSDKSKSAFSSIGSLNVTNIADGIAQFLIKRGKEELNVAFFNRLRKFLEGSQECNVLFPQSVGIFKNVEPYQYAEFIQSLREAFKRDLSNLAVGINELIELPEYRELLKNLPEIRLAIRSSKIVQELSQSDEGILPDSIITQLAALSEFGEIDLNLGSSWKLLDVISQSVRYVPNDSLKNALAGKDTLFRRWITLSDMNALVKDSTTLKIFLGLVYQKADRISFRFKGIEVSVQEYMRSNASNILTISSLIENFVTLANDVDRSIKDIKNRQGNQSPSNEDYYTYITKVINITEYGFKVANTIFRSKAIAKKVPDLSDNPYIIIAKNGNELYKNIYTKNYNSAIMNVHNILDQAFNNRKDLAEEKAITNHFNPAETKEFIESVTKIEVLNPKVLAKVLKYGNFMASVIKAESGEEVQSALDAAALPAGSYSIKQKSAFNFSLNGYIGYTWDFNDGLYAHGIYAPVGLSMSTGFRKYGITLSTFVSLIDVGGVATYRLQDDSTKTLKQDIKLESILSPSAQIFIEPIRNFPLAIGGGWRRTPKLFFSGNTNFTTIPSKDVFNLSILIDIPIFTFVNKPFNKRSN